MDLAKIRKKAGSGKRKSRRPSKPHPEIDEGGIPTVGSPKTGEESLPERPSQESNSGPAAGRIREFLLFRLGREYYGFPMEKISEIINIYSVTPVPRAPRHLEGIISLRGRMIPVIDLRGLLNIPEEEGGGELQVLKGTGMVTKRRKKGLVAEGPHGPLALMNDGVLDVVRIPEEELFPPPANLSDEELKFVEHVFIHEERLVSVLRVEKALHVF